MIKAKHGILAIGSVLLGCVFSLCSLQASAAPSGKAFVFDPQAHMWYAYENGQVINSGVAAGGSNWCRDIGRRCHTPTGYFSVLSKGGPGCKSSRYPRPRGGAPMGYCMFFTSNYAIHASNDVPAANVSHGCIRVRPGAAAWLSKNFMDYGTRVIVKSY